MSIYRRQTFKNLICAWQNFNVFVGRVIKNKKESDACQIYCSNLQLPRFFAKNVVPVPSRLWNFLLLVLEVVDCTSVLVLQVPKIEGALRDSSVSRKGSIFCKHTSFHSARGNEVHKSKLLTTLLQLIRFTSEYGFDAATVIWCHLCFGRLCFPVFPVLR